MLRAFGELPNLAHGDRLRYCAPQPNHSTEDRFGSTAVFKRYAPHVRYHPNSGANADISGTSRLRQKETNGTAEKSISANESTRAANRHNHFQFAAVTISQIPEHRGRLLRTDPR